MKKPHEDPFCKCEPCAKWWGELLCYADYCATMVFQAEHLFGVTRDGEFIYHDETAPLGELTLKELKKP